MKIVHNGKEYDLNALKMKGKYYLSTCAWANEKKTEGVQIIPTISFRKQGIRAVSYTQDEALALTDWIKRRRVEDKRYREWTERNGEEMKRQAERERDRWRAAD